MTKRKNLGGRQRRRDDHRWLLADMAVRLISALLETLTRTTSW